MIEERDGGKAIDKCTLIVVHQKSRHRCIHTRSRCRADYDPHETKFSLRQA